MAELYSKGCYGGDWITEEEIENYFVYYNIYRMIIKILMKMISYYL